MITLDDIKSRADEVGYIIKYWASLDQQRYAEINRRFGHLDDFKQEVWLKLFQTIQTPLDVKFTTAVTKNCLWVFLAYYSKDTLQERFERTIYPVDELPQRPTEDPEESRESERNKAAQKVAILLDSLPMHKRELVIMRAFKGMQFKQISKIRGASKQAAHDLYSRTIETLRDNFTVDESSIFAML